MIKVSDIIKYESGEMSESEELEFFDLLIFTGHVWNLQGHYQRRAVEILKQRDKESKHGEEL